MERNLPVLFLVFLSVICFAQTDTTICKLPEITARYNGGDSALFAFLVKNIVYPKQCIDSSIQGKVYVNCVIEKDGKVSSATIVKHVHAELDKEAERVAKLLPPFIAATDKNIAVRSALTIPISFKIKIKEKPVVAETEFLKVISAVDVPPQFPGGIKTLTKYIDQIFKYPFICTQLNIQGLCKVKFTVDSNGEATNISIAKGVHYDLDNEAIRVAKLLPDFAPALKSGKNTSCEMELSINFTLACSADDFYFSNEDDFRLKYPGGFNAMFNKIFDNTFYSGDLSGFGINGKSVIGFDVDTNGKVKNISVVQSTFPELEKIVLQAVLTLEKFKPGTINGTPQTGHIIFPVKYKAVANANVQNELNINRKFNFGKVDFSKEIYSYVDDLPEFDGRPIEDIARVLARDLKLPDGEEKNKDKAPVYIRCFISSEGKIINPHVYKGVSEPLEKEAIRVVQNINNVNPAYSLSKPIGFEVVIPVEFYNFR